MAICSVPAAGAAGGALGLQLQVDEVVAALDLDDDLAARALFDRLVQELGELRVSLCGNEMRENVNLNRQKGTTSGN